MIYLLLYYEFFKIGLFSIGGGLVTLPFLYALADRYGWITAEEILNMIAVAESTPGPIGINTATYAGFSTAGVLGGIMATLGTISPSLIIVTVIALYFMKFNESPMVRAAFNGIRPAVVGLIAAAGLQIAKTALLNLEAYPTVNNILRMVDYKGVILFLFMWFAINRFKKHPIYFIGAAALIGILFKL